LKPPTSNHTLYIYYNYYLTIVIVYLIWKYNDNWYSCIFTASICWYYMHLYMPKKNSVTCESKNISSPQFGVPQVVSIWCGASASHGWCARPAIFWRLEKLAPLNGGAFNGEQDDEPVDFCWYHGVSSFQTKIQTKIQNSA
jgi:hypothetical protein